MALSAQEGDEADDDFDLSVGGYAHSLTGIHDTGYPLPAADRRSAFNSEVVRIRWRASVGDRVVVDVHDRFQARVSTSTSGFGQSVAGLGVTAEPGRAVDLESVWVDDERLRVWHDLDRVAVTAYTPLADVTVGRQAITWGNSLLFPVADLWAPFSPYELDTEEKPGIDAVRALAYPAPGLELDLVVADRGGRDAWSGGVRATWSLASADLWGAAGRVWNEAFGAGGLTWLFDQSRARIELLAPRDLDADRWLDPRATAGLDWLGSRWTVSAEYHFNGLGAADPEGYLDVFTGRPFTRGESYYLGRSYLGGVVSWTVDEQDRFRVSGSALLNLGDSSGALFPALLWDLGPSTTLSVGGLVGFGEEPDFVAGPAPNIRSEYGTYGSLGYTRLSVYF